MAAADASRVSSLAVLLPLTSKNTEREALLARLETFFRTLLAGIALSPSLRVHVLVGVDAGDALFAPDHRRSQSAFVEVECTSTPGINAVATLFSDCVKERVGDGAFDAPLSAAELSAYVFSVEPGRVCAIWRQLARTAYAQFDCDFFVLLGDDVVFQSQHWFSHVLRGFDAVHQRHRALPWGFGVVALNDVTHPGFPTFPVLHRTHLDIFDGELFPSKFYNQDADPFLFEVYRRFSAAVFAPGADMRNELGGGVNAESTRYDKRHVTDWQHLDVPVAVARIRAWLEQRQMQLEHETVVVDVVVPTHRVDVKSLQRLLSLTAPAYTESRFVVVVDDPTKKRAIARLQHWLQQQSDRSRIRLFVNDRNRGASFTRNRGIAEAWSDWVLLLDDDVEPSADLLHAYSRAIRAHPRAGVLVGCTLLPASTCSSFARAATLLNVTEFWDVARRSQSPAWGVTANFLLRRLHGFWFRDSLTAGEEIDYCLRARARGLDVVGVPDAVVHHPWWDDGVRQLAGWAYGDGELMDHHARQCYRDWPDTAELCLCLVAYSLLLTVLGCADLAVAAACCCVAVAGVEVLLLAFDFRRALFALPSAQALRVLSCMFQIMFRSNVARLYGHVRRNGVVGLRHVCRRFDWSCGSQGFVENLRLASRRRFAVQAAAMLLTLAVV